MHVTAGEAKYWYHYIFVNWRELILLEDIVAGYARSTFRNYRGKFPSREDPIRCADNTTLFSTSEIAPKANDRWETCTHRIRRTKSWTASKDTAETLPAYNHRDAHCVLALQLV